ncbi:hypothetical protein TGFOU_254603 [Toxoplasma gondii FOU]|uniref:Transmembrane protein n=1 Tax=Toxoplasma gondii FOU TaxID=943167 RepID=A0A086L8V0_TOXGO|nr:hypothetical protein TGFOU_254603 [Toxoplasma gondii FOU]
MIFRQLLSCLVHVAAISAACIFPGFGVSGKESVVGESRPHKAHLQNYSNVETATTNAFQISSDVHDPSAARCSHLSLNTRPCSFQGNMGKSSSVQETPRLSKKTAGDPVREHTDNVLLLRQSKAASTSPVKRVTNGSIRTDETTHSGCEEDEFQDVIRTEEMDPQVVLVESSKNRGLYLRPPQLPSDIPATELSTFLARLMGSPLLFYGPFDNPDDPTLLTAAALEAATYWSKSIENLGTVLDVLYTAWERLILLPFSIKRSRSSFLKQPAQPDPVIPSPGSPQPNPAPSPGNPQPGPSPSPGGSR